MFGRFEMFKHWNGQSLIVNKISDIINNYCTTGILQFSYYLRLVNFTQAFTTYLSTYMLLKVFDNRLIFLPSRFLHIIEMGEKFVLYEFQKKNSTIFEITTQIFKMYNLSSIRLTASSFGSVISVRNELSSFTNLITRQTSPSKTTQSCDPLHQQSHYTFKTLQYHCT